MFAHDTFTAVFGATRPGELEILPGLVRAAVRAGYAIVLNEPGTKKPLCTLTAAARRKADREVQDAALEAGDPRASQLRHACGVHHALTEDDALKVTGLLKRLTITEELPDGTTRHLVPNIGVEPGASHMLAVDVDTAAENDAFLATWRAEDPASLPEGYGFTVASPGVAQVGPDGELDWVHKDGGHYWFTLPPGLELPREVGLFKDESGWGAAWRGRQLLVPPSVRAEGPYRQVGSPMAAPQWLLDRVFLAAEARRERERIRLERWEARQAGDLETDPVDAWSAATPWATLLEPDGWAATGLVDTCSCPVWTAPGGHASPKSATAHDEGCSRYDSDEGHAPLHIWTDNPPDYLAPVGSRTINRLTYVAYRDHYEPGMTKSQVESAAVIALGLAVRDGGPMAIDNPFDLPITESTSPTTQNPDQEELVDPRPSPADDANELSTPDPQPVDEFSTPQTADSLEPNGPAPAAPSHRSGTLLAYDSSELDDLPDPDPLIYGLLDRGSVAILSGKFGTYKSFLALDWAAHVAMGRSWEGHPVDEATPVVYIAAEGQVGVKRRVRGWRRRHLAGKHLPAGALTVIPQRVVLETDKDGKATAHLKELVALVNERGAGLVVFDTLSKSKGKASENDNSEMGAIMALVIEVTKATGATVLLVAHTGYSGEHTRGGSVQEDDADTVFVVKFEDPKSEDRSMENRRVLHHRKSKDGELAVPMVLVPRVEELGTDNHGRAITTLTLSTDPFVPTPKAKEAVSMESVLEELERLEAPRGLSQPKIKAWVKDQNLPESSHLRVRFSTWWAVYRDEYVEDPNEDQI